MADEVVDWSGVTEPMARQIFAQGETFMQAQLQAALAADARATAMAGLYTTLALAILAAGFGYWDKTGGLSPLASSGVTGVFLIVAAALAAWAARPIDFYYPGNQPSQWFLGRKADIAVMLGGEAENYDARIAYNDGLLAENQTAIKRAFVLAIASPIVGAAAWFVAATCSFFPA